MTFAGAPIATLGAVFATAAVAIALLHLVRPRRRRVVVAYLALVERALAGGMRGAGGMRLRRLLSLLLTLGALACIIAAAGDPRTALAPARTVVILVDAGASMQAQDEHGALGASKTRIERALEEARQIVRGFGPSDRALVVRLDDRPQPLGGFTSDDAALLRALSSIQATPARTNLDDGLQLAIDLVRDQPGPTIVLVSDGAAAEPSITRASLGAIDLRYVSVGTSSDDIGLSAFAARRSPSDPAGISVLVDVESAREQACEVELQLVANGQLVHLEKLELPPRGRAHRIFDDLAFAGERLEARLRSTNGAPLDVFPLDDRASLELAPRKRPRVLLVTDGNLFLEGALLADGRADLKILPRAQWSAQVAGAYDVVVLDGITPPEPLRVPALYLDPSGPSSPFPIRGALRDPIVTATARHPLTRYLDLGDVNVATASRLGLREGDIAVASSVGEVLYAARDSHPRVAALGFDVKRSDLPMRVAFPVLLANAIEWLSGSATGTAQPAVADGLDPALRRIAPRPSLTIEGKPIAAPDPPKVTTRSAPWRALLLLSLALLLFEWWAFHRRVTA